MPVPHDVSSADTQSRRFDLLLAVVLAGYPLLPSGPQYFGLPPANYSLIGIAMFAAIWVAARVREPRRSEAAGSQQPGRQLVWAWGAFTVVVTGAAFVGVSTENDFSSPVFWAHLREVPTDLLRPMSMVAEPMYPVTAWLVFLQGAFAFAFVRDLCLRASNPRRRARTALYGWLTGYGCVAGFALFQYVTRFQLHPYWVRINPGLVRSHSTFEDPNVLAAYLILGLGGILGFAWFCRTAAQPVGLWLSVLGLLGGAALYTTVSRSAWVGLPLAVILIAAFAPRTWVAASVHGRRYVRVGAMACLVGVLVIVGTVVITRVFVPTNPAGFQPASPLQAAFRTLDPTVALTDVFSSRLSWWGAAARMFADQPLVGVGLGRYPRLVPEYAGAGVPPENAHNVFLQILAETGLIGFAGLVLLVGTVFASLAASGSSRTEDVAIARGALLGVTAFLVTCLSGHPLLLASGQVVLATMLAAVLVAADGSRSPSPHSTTLRPHGHPMANAGSWLPTWKNAAAVVAGLGLLWYPAAALGHGARAWDKPSPWGYSWGLFPEEVAVGSGPFRWTGERAIVDLAIPPAVRSLELRIAAPSPIRSGRTVEARLQMGDRVEVHMFRTAEPATVFLDVDQGNVPDERRMRLIIDVEPALIPSEEGASDDVRRLGLQLFPPVWRGRHR